MADGAMHPYLPRVNPQVQGRRALAIGHHSRLLLDSGRVFMLLGALILACQLTTTAATPIHVAPYPYVFVAFLLWLLGAMFAMLSLIAGQFPILAAAAAAVATKLRSYLLGGL
ncbi:hypothetical protein ABZP36_011692 [Zizania latifolia]